MDLFTTPSSEEDSMAIYPFRKYKFISSIKRLVIQHSGVMLGDMNMGLSFL